MWILLTRRTNPRRSIVVKKERWCNNCARNRKNKDSGKPQHPNECNWSLSRMVYYDMLWLCLGCNSVISWNALEHWVVECGTNLSLELLVVELGDYELGSEAHSERFWRAWRGMRVVWDSAEPSSSLLRFYGSRLCYWK